MLSERLALGLILKPNFDYAIQEIQSTFINKKIKLWKTGSNILDSIISFGKNFADLCYLKYLI